MQLGPCRQSTTRQQTCLRPPTMMTAPSELCTVLRTAKTDQVRTALLPSSLQQQQLCNTILTRCVCLQSGSYCHACQAWHISFTHSFIHSCIRSSTHSFIHVFLHSFIASLIQLIICSFFHSFITNARQAQGQAQLGTYRSIQLSPTCSVFGKSEAFEMRWPTQQVYPGCKSLPAQVSTFVTR